MHSNKTLEQILHLLTLFELVWGLEPIPACIVTSCHLLTHTVYLPFLFFFFFAVRTQGGVSGEDLLWQGGDPARQEHLLALRV